LVDAKFQVDHPQSTILRSTILKSTILKSTILKSTIRLHGLDGTDSAAPVRS
jgi:hypothetical protein